MSPVSDLPTADETSSGAGQVAVHYWAAARAAAGTAADLIDVRGQISLTEVRAHAAALHPGTRLGAVLDVCSVLVGERPVSAQDPDQVLVGPGDTVEFLPPFAGG